MKVSHDPRAIVYVVSLSRDIPHDCDVSWLDIVEKYDRYCHPIGNGFTRDPQQYMGFRYDGHLQAIRPVINVQIIRDLTGLIPGYRQKQQEDNFLYTLGEPIQPIRRIPGGTIQRATRAYAAMDLLLTCDTIGEAVQRTKDEKRR